LYPKSVTSLTASTLNSSLNFLRIFFSFKDLRKTLCLLLIMCPLFSIPLHNGGNYIKGKINSEIGNARPAGFSFFQVIACGAEAWRRAAEGQSLTQTAIGTTLLLLVRQLWRHRQLSWQHQNLLAFLILQSQLLICLHNT
jgi:hypothetical protein